MSGVYERQDLVSLSARVYGLCVTCRTGLNWFERYASDTGECIVCKVTRIQCEHVARCKREAEARSSRQDAATNRVHLPPPLPTREQADAAK